MTFDISLPSADLSPAFALRQLIFGHRITETIAVAARLSLADLLGDTMQTAPVLAAQLDANPTALHGLLRALLNASRVIITNLVPARALMSILGRTRIVSTRAVAGPSAS